MTERQITGNAYFASDFHFGVPDRESSLRREEAIVRWLDRISADADHLFLLGDIFDFWFEYRDVVPKGYFRFFSKLLEMRGKGTKIYYFTGNHDMWVGEYFEKELGMEIFRSQQVFIINRKRCMVGHGDGLDPNDKGYLLIKKIFAFRPNILLYGALPPRWAFSIARKCSHTSRKKTGNEDFHKDDEDIMVNYILDYLRKDAAIDFFIFGHRHLPLKIDIENAVYFNTGDWLTHNSYLRASSDSFDLLYDKKQTD